jgi:hypothetical protein
MRRHLREPLRLDRRHTPDPLLTRTRKLVEHNPAIPRLLARHTTTRVNEHRQLLADGRIALPIAIQPRDVGEVPACKCLQDFHVV